MSARLIVVDTTVRDETDATHEEIAQAHAAGRAGYEAGIAFSAPALSETYRDLIAGRPVGQSRTRELAGAYTAGWYEAAEEDDQ